MRAPRSNARLAAFRRRLLVTLATGADHERQYVDGNVELLGFPAVGALVRLPREDLRDLGVRDGTGPA